MTHVDLIPISDARRWDDILSEFQGWDVYARRGYVSAASGDASMLAVVRSGSGSLAVPFVPRPLPEGDGQDAESPYGYPGVLVNGEVSECWDMLSQTLAEHGVVNLFLRLHPFADPAPCADLLIGPPHATAWIPLDEGRDAAFSGRGCATHRTQVNQARRMGFTTAVRVAPTTEELAEFKELYDVTMDRVDAADAYRFDDAYYERLRGGLLDDLVLVSTVDGPGMTVAAALMLCGPRYGHYHLGGRRGDTHNAAVKLLFEAMADEAGRRGLAGVHLGGGLTDAPDDSLLRFKQRIGRGRAQFHSAGLICDSVRHRQLIDDWSARSGAAPVWFQAYRQPNLTESER